MIYTSAIYTNPEHTMVQGTDALGNTETVPHDHTLFRQPDDGPVGFMNNGGVIADYIPPDPVPPIKVPSLIAMGQVKTDGADITSVSISAELAGAFIGGEGEIWCFFMNEQPDTEYMVLAYDANGVRAFVNDEDKETGYFVIRCMDFSGTPTNPPTLNFEVKRVI